MTTPMHVVKMQDQERLALAPSLFFARLDGSDTPPDYEASIDGGETWVPPVILSGKPVWIVATPGFPGPGDDSDTGLTQFTVTQGRTTMSIRAIDPPVTDIISEIEIVLLP